MSLSNVMRDYKRIKEKLGIVLKQFEKFKLNFQHDFQTVIAEFENKRIALAQQEAMKIVQQQKDTVRAPKSKDDINVEVEVNLRKLSKEETASEASAPAPQSAKMTKRIPPTSPPESAVAATKPFLGGQLSKLYRKLCKKYHPDVCGSDKQFMEVQQSYESGDNLGMIELAIQSDIQVDDYIDNTDEMVKYWKTEINRMEQEIYNLTHMLPWVWGMADGATKQEIRPNIIRQLEQNA